MVKFTTGVVDNKGWILTCKFLCEFVEKIWNDTNVIFRGLGEDDSWKNPKEKNLVALSL